MTPSVALTLSATQPFDIRCRDSRLRSVPTLVTSRRRSAGFTAQIPSPPRHSNTKKNDGPRSPVPSPGEDRQTSGCCPGSRPPSHLRSVGVAVSYLVGRQILQTRQTIIVFWWAERMWSASDPTCPCSRNSLDKALKHCIDLISVACTVTEAASEEQCICQPL